MTHSKLFKVLNRLHLLLPYTHYFFVQNSIDELQTITIAGAFTWSETKEGWVVWDKLDSKYIDETFNSYDVDYIKKHPEFLI